MFYTNTKHEQTIERIGKEGIEHPERKLLWDSKGKETRDLLKAKFHEQEVHRVHQTRVVWWQENCQAPAGKGSKVGPSLSKLYFSPKAVWRECVHCHTQICLLSGKWECCWKKKKKACYADWWHIKTAFTKVFCSFHIGRVRQVKSSLQSVNFGAE